jgi:hypothetical protein
MGRNVDGHLFDANGLTGRRCSPNDGQYDVNSAQCDQAPASQIAADWDLEEFSDYCSRTPALAGD